MVEPQKEEPPPPTTTPIFSSVGWCTKLLGCVQRFRHIQPVDDYDSYDEENAPYSDGSDLVEQSVEEWTPWVVDVGSNFMRAGWACDDHPSVVWRNRCGRPKATLELSAASRLLSERSEDDATILGGRCDGIEALLDVSDLVGESSVDDWNSLGRLLSRTMEGNQAAHLVIAAPLGFGRPGESTFSTFAADILDVVFEKSDVLRACSVVSAAPLPMFSSGLVEGCIIHAGHRRTVVAYVSEGHAEPHGVCPAGGRDAVKLPDGTVVLDNLFKGNHPVDALSSLLSSKWHADHFLSQNPVLHISGGASLFPNYAKTIESHLAARYPKLHQSFQLDYAPDAHAAWRGAGILGQSHEFTNWVSRGDYEEYGAHRSASSTFTL